MLKKPFTLKEVKTIGVFVGEDLLGDGILKYPFILQLYRTFPHSKITWISGHNKTIFSSLLFPLVKDTLHQIIDNQKIGYSWKELLKPVLREKFDLLINTHQSLKTTLILKKLPHTYFVDPTGHFIFSHFKPSENFSHISKRLLALIPSTETHETFSQQENLPITPLMKREIEKFFDLQTIHIGFAPGAGQQKKMWPLDRFIEVARAQEKKGRKVLFILGPAEHSWLGHLKKSVPTALFPLQESPEFLKNPFYTVAIAKHCDCLIANDSGTGHLLGLAQRPLISLFGPTASDKVRPYTPHGIVIDAKFFGGGSSIDLIPKSSVIEAIESCLKN